MATGKSTIGRALGRRMDAPFIDMDRELQKQFGHSIPEYFARHGEEAFREAETKLLSEMVAEVSPDFAGVRRFPRRYVLSTGGGVPLIDTNRRLLGQIGYVVWLRARVDTIAHRCRPVIDRRPMLHGHADDLEDHIQQLLDIRESHYGAIAQTEIWSDDASSVDEAAIRIRAAVQHV